MKKIFWTILILGSVISIISAQKGVDTQTKKITEDNSHGNKSSVGKEITFGGGKTKTSLRMENPARLASKRDILLQTITDLIAEKKLILDESASRPKDGILVTQPFTFARGVVLVKNELSRFADLPNSDQAWTRGRYTLTIEVQSIDGNFNNVAVTAKVEGRIEGILGAEWQTLTSSGEAEDEFLRALFETVTGVSTTEPKDESPQK